MRFLERSIALAAGIAGVAAPLAVADPTPPGRIDIAEAAVLTWAEGPGEDGARVRMFAGEIDGRGVVYAEYFKGNALWMAVPYHRVFINHDSESSIRNLRDLQMVGPSADGFVFTAAETTIRLKCTALLHADATINCTRSDAFVPKGSASCARYFKSNTERFQCNALQTRFAASAIPHDELMRMCVRSFRSETRRANCLRYGYNAASVSLFKDALATCSSAYRGHDERDSCMGSVLQGTGPDLDVVRECDREHDDDKAVTDCAWLRHTGVKQESPPSLTSRPTDNPTAPVANNATPRKPRLSGGRIDVTTGTWRDLSLRATGGMVESEPVLWVDAFRNEKLEWMQPVDRIVVGKQVRALREVSSLDKVKLTGELLTFRAVLGGKRLACRVDAASMFARCR
jgi:hypothetical protein